MFPDRLYRLFFSPVTDGFDQLYERGAAGPIKSMSRLDEFDSFFAEFKANRRYVALAADIFQVAPEEIV